MKRVYSEEGSEDDHSEGVVTDDEEGNMEYEEEMSDKEDVSV